MTDVAASVRTLANHIAGQWVEAVDAEVLVSRDPATAEPLACVPLSTAADVDRAVRAARAAQPAWRATSPVVRARHVMALREALVEHRAELARIVHTDMGKTLEDADGEVGRGIESAEAATAVPHLMKGESLEGVATGVDVELVRQPVGVVAAITPFNFPAMIPLWFLPFAVATGNTVVLKPSERDPLASERIVELCEGIFPPGVVNLVHGGREVVDGLLDHPEVDAVSFVGSATVARHVYARAARNGKRVQALGGAKNAMIVMPDADPDVMAGGVAASAFGAAGQRCLAGSVAVLVGTEAEQDAARDRIVAAAATAETCPLVDPAARERIEAEIDAAEREGVPILVDGRIDGGAAGAELHPTVAEVGAVAALEETPSAGRTAHDRLAREELFGPLLALVRAPTLAAAIAWVNAGRYGNAGVIFTTSGAAAREFRATVEAGMLGVNVGVAAPVAWFPFSGWKDSMAGDLHANGRDAIDFYTRKKVVTSRW